jgi:hypothetical protein
LASVGVACRVTPGIEELNVALEQVQTASLLAVVAHPFAVLELAAGEHPAPFVEPLANKLSLFAQGGH